MITLVGPEIEGRNPVLGFKHMSYTVHRKTPDLDITIVKKTNQAMNFWVSTTDDNGSEITPSKLQDTSVTSINSH